MFGTISSILGWLSILLAVFAMAIGLVPGAAGIMGMALSLLAVLVSLFSIKRRGRKYFTVTTGLACASLIAVNSTLRLWDPLPMPLMVKLGLYSAVAFVLACCLLGAWKLGR